MHKSITNTLTKVEKDERFGVLDDPESFRKLVVASPWLTAWLEQQADWQAELSFFRNAHHDAGTALSDLAQQWTIDDEATVMKELRQWRNRHMARLIARDALSLSTVRETARQVTAMADVAVQVALRWSQQFWRERDGAPAPCPHSGQPQELVILAMGKHGASELNLSSDIDLIFAFPSQGETDSGLSHEQFFTRVGRKLINLLDTRTADGIVFRVDMRLRPWGQSGALVSPFSALHHYYLHQGRFWERFAMLKARTITGDVAAQEYLESLLKPFIYRRYVDFQAIGALRELKLKIQREVRRQGLDRNIKLGAGGIREVEFLAQAFQLIRGGQDESLQQRGTWPVLSMLAQLGLLPQQVVTELTCAYDFLRDLEHKIQALRDEQTQMLPSDEADLERLANNMHQDSVDQLFATLQQHRNTVNHHFSMLIADENHRSEDALLDAIASAWELSVPPSKDISPEALSLAVLAIQSQPSIQRLKGEAKQNIDGFMPLLWRELVRFPDAVDRLKAIEPILEAIYRRSSYFVLLSENPGAIKELVKLGPVSAWIVKQLSEKPFLLDELTDTNSLYTLPRMTELHDELHQALLRVPEDDLERQMEVLRHFRHGRVLRAAACEVAGQLPLMKISDYLAWVAEVVIDQALALVWRQLVSKHGRPSRGANEWCDNNFGVIAYGKMGGLELSYESDLDLVFVHDADPQGHTEGPTVIDNSVFMARLGQKLIHMLSAITPSGMLYEVDTRLRPSGNSGLLVTSLAAFEKYQRAQAWTWEHQAIVRSRFIAGDKTLREKFNSVRRDIICLPRDVQQLRKDIVDMRSKMSDHLSTGASGALDVFDVKHDGGGIVDLEFLVQYLVLANAHDKPELADWSDNVRCIQTMANVGLIEPAEQEAWMAAYLALRREVHHAILSDGSRRLNKHALPEDFIAATELVLSQWQRFIGG